MNKPLIYLFLAFGGLTAGGAAVLVYGERLAEVPHVVQPSETVLKPDPPAEAAEPQAPAAAVPGRDPGSPSTAEPRRDEAGRAIAALPARRPADSEAGAAALAGEEEAQPGILDGLAPAELLPGQDRARPAEGPRHAEAARSDERLPAFDIVRVEPSGEAVIAGRAPPQSKVQILSDGQVVAETEADRTGGWVAVPEAPLPPGGHDLSIRALTPDGEEAESEQRVAVAVPEAPGGEVVAVLTVPGGASEVLAGAGEEPGDRRAEPQRPLAVAGSAETPRVQAEAEAAEPLPVRVDAVETEGDRVYVAGASDPDAVVRVYVDGDLLGEARAGAGGRWLIEASRPIGTGTVTVRADQLRTGSSQVEARAEVPFLRTVDMAALVPAARAGAGAGEVAAGDEPLQPAAVIIRSGDNLWTISRRTYGRGIRYTTIYRANEDQIRDPHWIYPGQVFMLPTRDRAWEAD